MLMIGTQRGDLLGGHQATVLDAHGLVDAVGGLEPLPALGSGGDRDATRHVEADVEAGLLGDLRQQVDRIRL